MPMHAQVLSHVKSDRVRRVAELHNRKTRQRVNRVAVEGPQSVREILTYMPHAVRDVYVGVDGSEDYAPFMSATLATLAGLAMQNGIYVHKATREVMQRMSADCQGIIAVADLQELRTSVEQCTPSDTMLVAGFWQIRDPGNAGNVIRSADAAGCDAVVFIDDCVDVYNPKVIRSTTGSLFHVPVLHMDSPSWFSWCAQHSLNVMAADVYGCEDNPVQSLPHILRDIQPQQSHAIMFGNEARGLPQEILEQTGTIVAIPMYGKTESMNLATSAAVMLMSIAMSGHIETI